MKTKPCISILGCGWLGLPLARHLVNCGYQVKGSTTSSSKFDALEAYGIKPYVFNFDPEPEGDIKDFFKADILFINIPPRSRTKDEHYHPSQVKAIIKEISNFTGVLAFVSSTSIYPKQDGSYAEDFPLTINNTGNRAIFKAEESIKHLKTRAKKYILRSAGQMGLQRIPGKYFAGKEIKGAWDKVNYIHQKDLIGLISLILDKKPNDGIYNLVAPEHPFKKDVVLKSASLMGYEKPIIPSEETGKNRVIVSRRLDVDLDYDFTFPDPLGFTYD